MCSLSWVREVIDTHVDVVLLLVVVVVAVMVLPVIAELRQALLTGADTMGP
jgi:hypothetical protein